jgi:outer membrane protein
MSITKKIFIVFIAFVCVLLMTHSAQAQDSPINIQNMPNVIGVGAGLLPDYMGSNDYMVGGAPFFRLTYPQTQYYARLLATDIQINVINHPVFRLGPAVNFRFGRNDDVEDDVVKHMKEIDGTTEAGAFIGFESVDKDNPRRRLIAQVEFLSDVGGEYKGYNVSLSASYWLPVSRPVDIMFGAGLMYASDNFMQTYFGVDQEDADRTGLPEYNAEARVFMAKLNGGAVLHLSQSWHVAAGVQFRPLLGEAADSPVVDTCGSSAQVLAGLGVAYSW